MFYLQILYFHTSLITQIHVKLPTSTILMNSWHLCLLQNFLISFSCPLFNILSIESQNGQKIQFKFFRYPTVWDGPSLFVSFIWVAPLCHCVNCNCSVCHYGKFCWLVVTPGGVGLIDGGEMGSSALRGWFLIPCWALTEQIEWSTLQPIVTDCFFR